MTDEATDRVDSEGSGRSRYRELLPKLRAVGRRGAGVRGALATARRAGSVSFQGRAARPARPRRGAPGRCLGAHALELSGPHRLRCARRTLHRAAAALPARRVRGLRGVCLQPELRRRGPDRRVDPLSPLHGLGARPCGDRRARRLQLAVVLVRVHDAGRGGAVLCACRIGGGVASRGGGRARARRGHPVGSAGVVRRQRATAPAVAREPLGVSTAERRARVRAARRGDARLEPRGGRALPAPALRVRSPTRSWR